MSALQKQRLVSESDWIIRHEYRMLLYRKLLVNQEAATFGKMNTQINMSRNSHSISRQSKRVSHILIIPLDSYTSAS